MTGVGVVLLVSERLSIPNEVLQVPGGDGKVQALPEGNLHVGDADDLAPGVEERSARVAGVDRGVGLNVRQAVEAALCRGDHAQAQGALEAEGIADGEGGLADLDALVGLEGREDEAAVLGMRDLEQGQIDVVVDGHDFDVLDDHALERAVGLREPHGGPQVRLALHHVGVGDRVTVGVDDHAGAEAAGRGDHDDRRPDTLGVLLGAQHRQAAGGVKERLGRDLDGAPPVGGLDVVDLVHAQGEDLRPHVEPDGPVIALEDRTLEPGAALERDDVRPRRPDEQGGDPRRERGRHLG